MIGDDIGLARAMDELMRNDPELEAFTRSLSITTFRYVPPDLRPSIGEPATEEHLNRLNEALLGRLPDGGEAFVSNAVLDGRYVMRACIVNFRTTLGDVRALPERSPEVLIEALDRLEDRLAAEGVARPAERVAGFLELIHPSRADECARHAVP